MSKVERDAIVMAFSPEQVERLTGLTQSQLSRWDRTGFFAPSMTDEDRNAPYSKIYTFRDVACLRVLGELRKHVSLQHLRDVKDALRHLGDDLWSKTTLYLLNKKVVIENPETGHFEEPVSKQAVFRLPLEVVTGSLKDEVNAMRKRSAENIGRIERKRGHLGSQPIIAGTRISVQTIKEYDEAGFSADEIMKEYPSLSREDVQAALTFESAA